jgi:hypothetical protein
VTVKDRRLQTWSGVLIAMILIHDLDHVRQGRALGSELYGVGAVALVTAVGTYLLAARNHRFAPAAAFIVGFGNLVGVPLVHVVPHWGPFSDPYPAAHVDWFSWVVVAAMMLVGLVLGVIATDALRKQTGRVSPPSIVP